MHCCRLCTLQVLHCSMHCCRLCTLQVLHCPMHCCRLCTLQVLHCPMHCCRLCTLQVLHCPMHCCRLRTPRAALGGLSPSCTAQEAATRSERSAALQGLQPTLRTVQ